MFDDQYLSWNLALENKGYSETWARPIQRRMGIGIAHDHFCKGNMFRYRYRWGPHFSETSFISCDSSNVRQSPHHTSCHFSSPIPCSGISSDSIILTLIWTLKPYLQSHVRMATTAWAGQCMRVTNYIIVPTCHSLIKSSFQNGLHECFTCFLNVNICAAVYHLILR